eukprot:c3953_g1_i1.p1 GENE.c3953_g1_i1~~c3953_g1_i1.p1  ORF type:complete len:272 (+),score=62.76 c3953_g1_i1:336-1151(+)
MLLHIQTISTNPPFLILSMFPSMPSARHPLRVAGNTRQLSLGTSGELGLGPSQTYLINPTPMSLSQSSRLSCIKVSCGWKHTLFLTATGQVFACGSNKYGQCCPTSTQTPSPVLDCYWHPQHIALPSNTTQPHNPHTGEPCVAVHDIKCGWNHSGALCVNGELLMWGRNSHGQCGGNAIQIGFVRVQVCFASPMSDVPASDRIRSFGCGSDHTVAVCESGQVAVWGWGEHHQTGTTTITDAHSPQCVPLGPHLTACDFAFTGGAFVIVCGK